MRDIFGAGWMCISIVLSWVEAADGVARIEPTSTFLLDVDSFECVHILVLCCVKKISNESVCEHKPNVISAVVRLPWTHLEHNVGSLNQINNQALSYILFAYTRSVGVALNAIHERARFWNSYWLLHRFSPAIASFSFSIEEHNPTWARWICHSDSTPKRYDPPAHR